MILSSRQKKIIQILNGSNFPLTGAALSALLQVSDRTIRSDIFDINLFFKNKIIISTQRGYLLNRKELFQQNKLNNFENFISDEDFLIKSLMLDYSYVDMYSFCDERFISTSSLSTIVKNVQKRIEPYSLSITRKNNLLFISGSLDNKHLFLNTMIQNDINPSFKEIKNCNVYFKNIDIQLIKKITIESIKEFNYHIEETHATSLIINIGIAFSRILKNYDIDIPLNNEMKRHVQEYKISERICNKFEDKYQIKLSINDINYIHFLVLGFIRPQSFNKKNLSLDNNPKLVQTIHKILQDAENYYQIDLNIDSSLISFVLHVQSLILRRNNNNRVLNPIKENLKKNSFFIFDISVFIANQLSQYFDITIDDDEIAFIAVHIGFQFEKENKIDQKLNILLEADNYSEIQKKLKNEISEDFGNVIEVYSENNSKQITYFDLIVTTKIQTKYYGRSIINISPFYNKRDHLNVHSQILNLFKSYKKDLYKELMKSYFDKDLFYKNIDFKNKEEAIEFLSSKLIENNIVDDNFTDSVLEREKLSSTAFYDLFSVPHALDMNAHKTIFTILINSKPLNWGDTEVYAVILVAINLENRPLFQDIYNGLIEVFGNPNNYRDLIDSEDFEEFIDYISSYFLN